MEPENRQLIEDLDKKLDQLIIERNCIQYINDGIEQNELPSGKAQVVIQIADNLLELVDLREKIVQNHQTVNNFYRIEGSSSESDEGCAETG